MRGVVLVALLLLVTGCMGRPVKEAEPSQTISSPEPLDKYAYRGTQCVELGLDVPVELSKVRPHVPSQYKLTEVQGKAIMAFAFARCDRMVPFNVTPPRQVVQVDVAVMIEQGQYEIAYTTSDRAIAKNASRVASFPAIHAPTSTMIGFPLQGTDIVQVHIHGGNITIDVDATAARANAATAAGGTYYNKGENGTSRMVYDVRVERIGGATGKITVPTGSMLAAIFGTTKVDGAGFYASFGLGANLTRLPG